jgi:hypothetical protein
LPMEGSLLRPHFHLNPKLDGDRKEAPFGTDHGTALQWTKAGRVA